MQIFTTEFLSVLSLRLTAATANGGVITATDLAADLGVPMELIREAVKLNFSDTIEARRGRKGGFAAKVAPATSVIEEAPEVEVLSRETVKMLEVESGPADGWVDTSEADSEMVSWDELF